MIGTKERSRALLVSGWALCMLFSTMPAFAATPPLWVFEPGAPDEPRWTVLELEFLDNGSRLGFTTDMSQVRCPSVTSFVLLLGPPENYRPKVGLTFDFREDQVGGQFAAHGEVELTQEAFVPGACPNGSLNFGFKNISAGRHHLLHFTAGTPYVGRFELAPTIGRVSLVGVAAGDSTFLYERGDFDTGAYAGTDNPSECVNGVPAIGNACTTGGVDVGVGRSKALRFEGRPWFDFSAWSPGLTKGGVQGPDEFHPFLVGQFAPSAAGVDPGMGVPSGLTAGDVIVSPFVSSVNTFDVPNLPGGDYAFRIDGNVQVATPLSASYHWKLVGADFRFPQDP
jgi:hypothetical protein